MTASHGASEPGHLTPDVLADLDEGLLEGEEAAAARRHLESCRECANVEAELAGLRAALASDESEPMPADVVALLEAALRGGMSSPSQTVQATSLADHRRRHTTRRSGRARPPRWMSIAAAAVGVTAVGLGGVAGYQALGGSSTTMSDSAVTASDGSAERNAAAGLTVTSSGADYTAATVEAAARRLSSGASDALQAPAASGGSAAGTQGAPYATQLDRLATAPGVAACVALLAGGPANPLAVDLARFDGKPAALVVLPTAGDPTRVDAWVVGEGCGEGSDAQVLYFRRVRR